MSNEREADDHGNDPAIGGTDCPGSGMSAIFPPEDTGARFLPVNAGEDTIVDIHIIFRKENCHA